MHFDAAEQLLPTKRTRWLRASSEAQHARRATHSSPSDAGRLRVAESQIEIKSRL
jgi:hypothetical protein